jgi:hypothetical protein
VIHAPKKTPWDHFEKSRGIPVPGLSMAEVGITEPQWHPITGIHIMLNEQTQKQKKKKKVLLEFQDFKP